MESSSLSVKPKTRKLVFSGDFFLLGMILVLAAFLRLYRISDYMEFLGDQGRDVYIVAKFLKQGDLMFIGPQTSIGNMYLGPWYYYLMAPFLLIFNFNPVGPAVMVAIFGVLTVWLIFKATSAWFSRQTALIAALIASVAPKMIYYSSFSWNPNIMPFFALWAIWLTWLIWEKKQYDKLLFLAAALAMVLNSHYLGLLLFPVVGIFWLITLFKVWKTDLKKKFIKSSLIAGLVFVALMSPLALFDLKHNFANTRSFINFFTVRQTTVNLKAYKGLTRLPEISAKIFADLFSSPETILAGFIFIAVLLISLTLIRTSQAFWLLMAWLAIGLLGLSNYKQHIYSHYFGFLWPAVVILIAALISKLRSFSFPLIFFITGFALLSWHGRKPANFQLQRANNVAEFIAQEAGNEPIALALIAKQNYDPPYRYFLEAKGVEIANLHETMPNQLFVICELDNQLDCNPIGHELWDIASFGWAEIENQWQVEQVKLFKLIHYQDKNEQN